MDNGVEILWAKCGEMDAGLQMQEHSHICYQLHYILRGEPVFIINDCSLPTRAHSYFLIPPNTPHRMLPYESGRIHVYDLKFLIHDPYILAHLPKEPLLLRDDVLVQRMLDYIARSWTNKDPRNVSNMEQFLCTLLSSFYLDAIRYESSDSRHIDTRAYNPITRSVITYIEQNFQQPFSLQRMAEELNYNKNYLSTVFSRTTGVSVVDYLNLMRIRQTVIFFAYYNQDVFTACESIGFASPSHFSRVFKSLVGISPRNFKYAFSSVDRQSVSQHFTEEPILNYTVCSLEEAFASLKSIGRAAARIIDEKTAHDS